VVKKRRDAITIWMGFGLGEREQDAKCREGTRNTENRRTTENICSGTPEESPPTITGCERRRMQCSYARHVWVVRLKPGLCFVRMKGERFIDIDTDEVNGRNGGACRNPVD
jgi:hypothetical protein